MAFFKKKANGALGGKDTPALEWILGIVGAVLLLAGIVYLLYQDRQDDGRVGNVTLRVASVSQTGDNYLVRFTARNEGSQTLVALNVSAQLLDGDEEIASAAAVIDYLPGRSLRGGGFYFSEDPRRHRLELHAEGYQDP